MNTLLVIVQIPSAEKHLGLVSDYQALITNPKTIPTPNTGVEKPAENVWLIPLDGGLRFLAGLFCELDSRISLQFQIFQLGKHWSLIESRPPATPPAAPTA
jgi:hypothetical protein